jgi:hypothetical protein
MFSLFDCHRPTYRGHTGFVFPVGKSDFPSPDAALSQLNNGVFYSFVLHKISPHVSGAGHKPKWLPGMFTCELNGSDEGGYAVPKTKRTRPMRRPHSPDAEKSMDDAIGKKPTRPFGSGPEMKQGAIDEPAI